MSFQHSQPDATNTSGTLELFRYFTTARWVGVPSPSKIANTLSCSTSWCTTVEVMVGSYWSFRYL